jgi:retron-type reverse transcriptase
MQARKAHSLIGQVYDPRNLSGAWERVKENRGAGGVDGMTVTRFDEDRDHYLQQKLKDGSYKPRRFLWVEIEKPGSTAKRPLGI